MQRWVLFPPERTAELLPRGDPVHLHGLGLGGGGPSDYTHSAILAHLSHTRKLVVRDEGGGRDLGSGLGERLGLILG